MSELLFIIGYILDIAIITYVSHLGWKAVGFMVITNMILIATLAQKEILFFGLHTNATSLCFAAVIYCMSICAAKYDFHKTMKIVHATFLSFISFIVLSTIISHMPVVGGNEKMSEIFSTLFQFNARIITASFLSFYISNSINIFFINSTNFTCKLWKRKIIGNTVGQFLDSIIFFPIAFIGILPTATIIEFTVGGFVLKAVLNLLDTLVFVKFAKLLK